MTSEFDLIARFFKRPAPPGMLGVGDDCALFGVPAGRQVATSTDLLLEGRHFFSDVDPESLGHKALAVNLSDLAAMGATPIGCVLGIGLPHADEAWVAAFAKGFNALADRLNCPLIGGDTTRSTQGIVISVTVFGAVDPQHALRRDNAVVGDDIWVSGELGAADIAYRLLAGLLPGDPQRLALVRPALEWPEPHVALGLALNGVAHAALDLSDGLLQDLSHILKASGVGANIDYAALPIAAVLGDSAQGTDNTAAVGAAFRSTPISPDAVLKPSGPMLPLTEVAVQHAVLGGGDVYTLCFTAAPERRADVLAAAAQAGTNVSRIGSVRAGTGLTVTDAAGRTLDQLPSGFDHFQAL